MWPTVSELFTQNVSLTFVELCMKTPYWCTVFGAPIWPWEKKHLEFTFPIKALSFHSRTSIRAHKHNGYTAENQEERLFSTRQQSYFGVSHCENSEVQIAVFSK